jgi:hypothetical protein
MLPAANEASSRAQWSLLCVSLHCAAVYQVSIERKRNCFFIVQKLAIKIFSDVAPHRRQKPPKLYGWSTEITQSQQFPHSLSFDI